MALKVDGDEVFGAGPAELVAGGVEKRARETPFAGLAGVRVLPLGGDRREFRQRGLLVGQGTTGALAETALQALRAGVDALVLDAAHVVTDGFGRVWSNLVLLRWSPTGPRQGPEGAGSSWRVIQPYEAVWLEVAAEAAS